MPAFAAQYPTGGKNGAVSSMRGDAAMTAAVDDMLMMLASGAAVSNGHRTRVMT